MRLQVLVMGCIAGCGRIGFDPVANGGGDNADAVMVADDTGAGSDAPLAAPPNDLCANAINASAGGTWMGTTCGAADEYTNSCFTAGAPDVWFVIVRGPSGGIITFDMAVTPGFVTKTGTGMCGDSTLTNCRITTIASQANMTYPIVVESEAGDCGPFVFTVNII
jgi:hypothetical protein